MNVQSSQVTVSGRQTEELGAEFAHALRPGDVVLLVGDLGAGKTTFARGALRGLGVVERVTSPTFTIAQRYEGRSAPVSHVDLYRLEEGLEGEIPGLLESEVGEDRITFVEWPERVGIGAICHTTVVELTHQGGDRRLVRIN